MDENNFIFSIINQYKYPIVFVNNNHIIEYLNTAAISKYSKRGINDLLHKSIFDCHNPASKSKILEYHKKFIDGENEFFIQINRNNQRVYMVAVRDKAGNLTGYYERFEDINNPVDR